MPLTAPTPALATQGVRDEVNAAERAVDAAAKGTGFSCKRVSWEDVSRSSIQGQVSCWGGNINDVRLTGKDGESFFVVRSENWNERLGFVPADKVEIVAHSDPE